MEIEDMQPTTINESIDNIFKKYIMKLSKKLSDRLNYKSISQYIKLLKGIINESPIFFTTQNIQVIISLQSLFIKQSYQLDQELQYFIKQNLTVIAQFYEKISCYHEMQLKLYLLLKYLYKYFLNFGQQRILFFYNFIKIQINHYQFRKIYQQLYKHIQLNIIYSVCILQHLKFKKKIFFQSIQANNLIQLQDSLFLFNKNILYSLNIENQNYLKFKFHQIYNFILNSNQSQQKFKQQNNYIFRFNHYVQQILHDQLQYYFFNEKCIDEIDLSEMNECQFNIKDDFFQEQEIDFQFVVKENKKYFSQQFYYNIQQVCLNLLNQSKMKLFKGYFQLLIQSSKNCQFVDQILNQKCLQDKKKVDSLISSLQTKNNLISLMIAQFLQNDKQKFQTFLNLSIENFQRKSFSLKQFKNQIFFSTIQKLEIEQRIDFLKKVNICFRDLNLDEFQQILQILQILDIKYQNQIINNYKNYSFYPYFSEFLQNAIFENPKLIKKNIYLCLYIVKNQINKTYEKLGISLLQLLIDNNLNDWQSIFLLIINYNLEFNQLEYLNNVKQTSLIYLLINIHYQNKKFIQLDQFLQEIFNKADNKFLFNIYQYLDFTQIKTLNNINVNLTSGFSVIIQNQLNIQNDYVKSIRICNKYLPSLSLRNLIKIYNDYKSDVLIKSCALANINDLLQNRQMKRAEFLQIIFQDMECLKIEYENILISQYKDLNLYEFFRISKQNIICDQYQKFIQNFKQINKQIKFQNSLQAFICEGFQSENHLKINLYRQMYQFLKQCQNLMSQDQKSQFSFIQSYFEEPRQNIKWNYIMKDLNILQNQQLFEKVQKILDIKEIIQILKQFNINNACYSLINNNNFNLMLLMNKIIKAKILDKQAKFQQNLLIIQLQQNLDQQNLIKYLKQIQNNSHLNEAIIFLINLIQIENQQIKNLDYLLNLSLGLLQFQTQIDQYDKLINLFYAILQNTDHSFIKQFVQIHIQKIFALPLKIQQKQQLTQKFLMFLGMVQQKSFVEDIEIPTQQLEKLQQKYLDEIGNQCTYMNNLKNKEQFSEQHYYQCYTCQLIERQGCCSVCLFKCHQNHDVVYCRKNQFFCDCSDQGHCVCFKKEEKSFKEIFFSKNYNLQMLKHKLFERLDKNKLMEDEISEEKIIFSQLEDKFAIELEEYEKSEESFISQRLLSEEKQEQPQDQLDYAINHIFNYEKYKSDQSESEDEIDSQQIKKQKFQFPQINIYLNQELKQNIIQNLCQHLIDQFNDHFNNNEQKLGNKNQEFTKNIKHIQKEQLCHILKSTQINDKFSQEQRKINQILANNNQYNNCLMVTNNKFLYIGINNQILCYDLTKNSQPDILQLQFQITNLSIQDSQIVANGIYDVALINICNRFHNSIINKIQLEKSQDIIIKSEILKNQMIVVFMLKSIRIVKEYKQIQQLNLIYKAIYKSHCIKDDRIFISTNEGNLFTHVIDQYQEAELILVETIFTSKKGVIFDMLWVQDQIFLSYDDGQLLICRFDEQKLEFQSQMRIQQFHGDSIILNLRVIEMNDGIKFSCELLRQNFTIPCLFSIQKDQLQFNIINEQSSLSIIKINNQIVNLQDDLKFQLFTLERNQLQDIDIKDLFGNFSHLFDLSYYNKQCNIKDLYQVSIFPVKPHLFLDFCEKFENISNRAEIQFEGDFDQFERSPIEQNETPIQIRNKNGILNLKMIIQQNYVITGLRIKLSPLCDKQLIRFKIKIFDREILINPKIITKQRYFDFPLSVYETIHIYLNKQFSIILEDKKGLNFDFYYLEVYGQNKDIFQIDNKIQQLQQIFSLKPQDLTHTNQIMNSNQNQLFNNLIYYNHLQQNKLIQSLDTLHMLIQATQNQEDFQNYPQYNQIIDYIKLYIKDDNHLGKACKRLLKNITQQYQLIKDEFEDMYNIKFLIKLLRKRKQQLIKIFKNQDFKIENLIDSQGDPQQLVQLFYAYQEIIMPQSYQFILLLLDRYNAKPYIQSILQQPYLNQLFQYALNNYHLQSQIIQKNIQLLFQNLTQIDVYYIDQIKFYLNVFVYQDYNLKNQLGQQDFMDIQKIEQQNNQQFMQQLMQQQQPFSIMKYQNQYLKLFLKVIYKSNLEEDDQLEQNLIYLLNQKLEINLVFKIFTKLQVKNIDQILQFIFEQQLDDECKHQAQLIIKNIQKQTVFKFIQIKLEQQIKDLLQSDNYLNQSQVVIKLDILNKLGIEIDQQFLYIYKDLQNEQMIMIYLQIIQKQQISLDIQILEFIFNQLLQSLNVQIRDICVKILENDNRTSNLILKSNIIMNQSNELFQLLKVFLNEQIINNILDQLKQVNFQNINQKLYQDLKQILISNKSLPLYLEMNGCERCFLSLETEIQEIKFKFCTIKKEIDKKFQVKYLNNSVILKLNQQFNINQINLNLNFSSIRLLKQIKIYFNNQDIDILELKNINLWKKLHTFQEMNNNLQIKFEFPVQTKNLYIEFIPTKLIESPQECVNCRHISYDRIGLICQDCGYSRLLQFDFNIYCKSGIDKDNNHKALQNSITEGNHLFKQQQQKRIQLQNLIHQFKQQDVKTETQYIVQDIYNLYFNDIAQIYQQIIKNQCKQQPNNNCYSCAKQFQENFYKFLTNIDFKNRNIGIRLLEILEDHQVSEQNILLMAITNIYHKLDDHLLQIVSDEIDKINNQSNMVVLNGKLNIILKLGKPKQYQKIYEIFVKILDKSYIELIPNIAQFVITNMINKQYDFLQEEHFIRLINYNNITNLSKLYQYSSKVFQLLLKNILNNDLQNDFITEINNNKFTQAQIDIILLEINVKLSNLQMISIDLGNTVFNILLIIQSQIIFNKNQITQFIQNILNIKNLNNYNYFLLEIQNIYLQFLEKIYNDDFELKKIVLTEYVKRLKNEYQSEFILEQMIQIINPQVKEESFYIQIDKKKSQEDFLIGQLRSNPYLNTDIGTTMRDIRTKVYKELEFQDYDENDQLLELLVAGQIINLDLNIGQVYKKVWLQNKKNCPTMIVNYRISGFEGEATETIIDNLQNDNQTKEQKFQITKFLLEKIDEYNTGIDIILQQCKQSKNKKLLVEILQYATELPQIRLEILQRKGIDIIIRLILDFIQKNDEQSIQTLLVITEQILMESNNQDIIIRRKQSDFNLDIDQKIQDIINQLNICLQKIESMNKNQQNQKNINLLTQLLPYICLNYEQPNQILINFFSQDVTNYLQNKQYRQFQYDTFIRVIKSLPNNSYKFKQKANQICEQAIQNIQQNILLEDSLQIISYLIKDNVQIQDLLSETKVIELIYQFKTQKNDFAIDIIENILQQSEQTKSQKYIQENIEMQKQLNKQKAEEKKQQILNKMNKFKPQNVQQESGLKCVICLEGYNLSPQKLLGVYIFSQIVKIHPYSKNQLILNQMNQLGISSVSHLNFIHLECHLNTSKIDKQSKQQKQEWDGASIRNQHTKCNAWFPFKSNQITDLVYIEGISKTINSFEQIIKNYPIDHNQFAWIVVNDLKNLLIKISQFEDLSKISQGQIYNYCSGGYEHNFQLIPIFMQQILFNTEKQKKYDYYKKFIQSAEITNIDGIYLYLTICLITQNKNDWNIDFRFNCINMIFKFFKSNNSSKQFNLIGIDKDEDGNFTIIKDNFIIEELTLKQLNNLYHLFVFINLIHKIIIEIFEKNDKQELIHQNEKILQQFLKLHHFHKNELNKIQYFSDFLVLLDLKSHIIQQYQTVNQFIKTLQD